MEALRWSDDGGGGLSRLRRPQPWRLTSIAPGGGSLWWPWLFSAVVDTIEDFGGFAISCGGRACLSLGKLRGTFKA